MLSSVFLLFLLAHTALSGRWWFWNIFSALPSRMFLWALLILAIVFAIRRTTRGIVWLTLSLPFVWINADLAFPAAAPLAAQEEHAHAITLFSWNTEFWETREEGALYAFIKEQQADIYHLQEHVEITKRPLYDHEELQREFPDHAIVERGEFITMTRYPILSSHLEPGGAFLRTDIRIGEEVVRFYNVHVLAPVGVEFSSVYGFLEDLRKRFSKRAQDFAALQKDIESEETPFLLSGDFNTTAPMGSMRPFLSLTDDALRASEILLPSTWQIGPLKWWRIDYALFGPGLSPLHYEEVAPFRSDHWGMRVTFTLPSPTPDSVPSRSAD